MLKTNLKQINNKRTLANLLKDAFLYDIVYQKHNIKFVIQVHAFQFYHFKYLLFLYLC